MSECRFQRIGRVLAADRNMAGKKGCAGPDNVDRSDVCADVQQSCHLLGWRLVAHLPGILQRKSVNINDHRRLTGLFQNRGVVEDLLALDGCQHDVKSVSSRGGRPQHFVVPFHFVQIELDVLFGFVGDRFSELLRTAARYGDLLHDHRVPGDRGCHFVGLDVILGKDLIDRLGKR